MLIAIDHGNFAVKTPNFSFVSGYIENTVPPAIADECLEYNGKYYSLTEKRLTYRRDKTKDEAFFILTLIAIAKELHKQKIKDEFTAIDLAVGLPPEHYGVLKNKFAEYFKRSDVISFVFNGNKYNIAINSVMVFPQSFSAMVTQSDLTVSAPRIFVVDIGGYTTDILLLRHGKPDMQYCKSLDNGVITMNNEIISKVNVLYDMHIDDEHVTEVLTGKSSLPKEIQDYVFETADKHANFILAKLKELEIDLSVTNTVFVGGGSLLLRKFLEKNGRFTSCSFVEDPCANAKGYMLLGQAALSKKRG